MEFNNVKLVFEQNLHKFLCSHAHCGISNVKFCWILYL